MDSGGTLPVWRRPGAVRENGGERDVYVSSGIRERWERYSMPAAWPAGPSGDAVPAGTYAVSDAKL